MLPNNAPEPTAVGAVSSAIAGGVSHPPWLSLDSLGHFAPHETYSLHSWSYRVLTRLVGRRRCRRVYCHIFHSTDRRTHRETWHWHGLAESARHDFRFVRRHSVVSSIGQRAEKEGCQMRDQWPNKSPEPTAVGAGRSAVAVHAASRRWLSFFR